MNKAILLGRLTRDPEIKKTTGGHSVCTFTLAVDRGFQNKDGEKITDFIPVVAWRQKAEFVSKYFFKGQRMLVEGQIQPRSYEDDAGQKRYITEVIANEIHFADGKKQEHDEDHYQPKPAPEPEPDCNTDYDQTALPFDV